MSAIITSLFVAATAAAYAGQFLDWYNTKRNIAASGLTGEKNPIMKFLFGKSQYLALAYKMLPASVLALGAAHFHDIKYFGVQYVNAPGVDKWAIAWILAQVAVAGMGFGGYVLSKK